MKEIVILAGPNGAGKTSFARNYFQLDDDMAFLNADEIKRELIANGYSGGNVDLAAGRLMLQRMDDITSEGRELMFETTLATRIYVRKVQNWKRLGYTVSLIYLRLPSAEASLARVARRVAAGGHDIPSAIVKQRFSRSRDYFERLYKPIVDDWYVYSSLEGDFECIQAWDDP